MYIIPNNKYFDDINDIYKGDGINTCKWCGDTGWMHTFSWSSIPEHPFVFYNDAPCMCCEKGNEILMDKIKEEHKEK